MESRPVHWYELKDGAPDFGRRLRRFLQLVISPADVWLCMRMMLWAIVLPLLKILIPVKSLARFMWMSPRTPVKNVEQEQKIAIIVRWIYLLVLSSKKNCVERSLLLYRFLSRTNSDPTLVTGLRQLEDGTWKGHAWILVNGVPFGETESNVEDFKTLVIFGRHGAIIEH